MVLIDNHGFASIGGLSGALGSGGFGTEYRYRTPGGALDGAYLPVDLAANAESLGACVLRVRSMAELEDALRQARAMERTVVIHWKRSRGARGWLRNLVGRARGRDVGDRSVQAREAYADRGYAALAPVAGAVGICNHVVVLDPALLMRVSCSALAANMFAAGSSDTAPAPHAGPVPEEDTCRFRRRQEC